MYSKRAPQRGANVWVALLALATSCAPNAEGDALSSAHRIRTDALEASAEFGPTEVTSSLEGAIQSDPVGAFDGVNWLVVWVDERRGNRDLMGVRVSQAGQLLDPQGVAVFTARYDQDEPAVTFDGRQFLVAWSDKRLVSDIRAALIAPTGEIVTPGGFLVSTVSGSQIHPAVTAGRGHSLIVWEDGRLGTTDIYGARIGPTGEVLDPGGQVITSAWSHWPAVALVDPNYFVVWQAVLTFPIAYDLVGVRVSPTAQVLGSEVGIGTSTANQFAPSIAAVGGVALVAASQDVGNGAQEIICHLVASDGTVLNPAGQLLSVSSTNNSPPKVSVAGDGFMVAWQQQTAPSSLRVARVTTTGGVLDPGGRPLITSASGNALNALVPGADLTLALLQNGTDVLALRISDAGVALDPAPFALSLSGNTQRRPKVASLGDAYVVVWEDGRGPSSEIYAARLSPQMQSFGDAGLLSSGHEWATAPALAVMADQALVAWAGRRDDAGVRTFINSATLGAEGRRTVGGFSASTLIGSMHPAVAPSAEGALVVYQLSNRIEAIRVDALGAPIDDAGVLIATNVSNLGVPVAATAFDGTNYLVVWLSNQLTQAVRAVRVSPSGLVLDPDGGILIAATAYRSESPALAFDGEQYLVVWQGPGRGADIFGARISRAGEVLGDGGFIIASTPGDDGSPTVAYDGHRFTVVWQDNLALEPQLVAAHVSGQGQVGPPISLGRGQAPSVAFGAGDAGLLVYQAFDDSPGVHTMRVKARWLHVEPEGLGLRLDFVTPSRGSAQCGLAWQTSAAQVVPAGVATYRLVETPEGVSLDPSSGALSWRPTRAQVGQHVIRLEATSNATTAERDITVEVTCPPLAPMCGCTQAPQLLCGWLVALALARSRVWARRR